MLQVKVVITATNMLETMTEKPRATRSEVSDVFNAVIDGTDATMLSGESANGKYPLESVTTMATIDKNAQTLLNEYGRLNSDSFERNSKTEVMASAVKDATNSMDIKLVVTLTKTGHTARLISKYRPNADILALTFDELTERGLMLNWGVIPMLTDAPSSTDDMFEIAERKAVEAGLVESGDVSLLLLVYQLEKLFVQTQCVSVQYVNLTLKSLSYQAIACMMGYFLSMGHNFLLDI